MSRTGRPALTLRLRPLVSIVLVCAFIILLWYGTNRDSRWHPSQVLSSASIWQQQGGDSGNGNNNRPGTKASGGKNRVEDVEMSQAKSNANSQDTGYDVAITEVDESKSPSSSPYPLLPTADTEEYMSVCMSVKNQTLDLAEFLVHHYHHHGIRRFYIHDDGTEPPLSTYNYSIPSSALTFIYHAPVPHNPNAEDRAGIQEKYYTDCATQHREKHTWMGFLDADEYIEMTGGETLSDFLHEWARNETVGAVGMNWLLHSSAGLLTRPEGDSRKAYNKCIIDNPNNDNQAVKSFVRLSLFERLHNVHCMAEMKNGAIEVGEHGDQVHVPCSRKPISRDRWGLHHFATKSRQEFLEKQMRGHIQGGGASEDWWHQVEDEEQWDCLSLTKYVP